MSRRPASSPVDIQKIERLAELSRLTLTERDAKRLQGELSSILDYFATLDNVDLSRTRPRETTAEGGLRQDVVKPSTSAEVLKGVPQRKGRLVKAPKVF